MFAKEECLVPANHAWIAKTNPRYTINQRRVAGAIREFAHQRTKLSAGTARTTDDQTAFVLLKEGCNLFDNRFWHSRACRSQEMRIGRTRLAWLRCIRGGR